MKRGQIPTEDFENIATNSFDDPLRLVGSIKRITTLFHLTRRIHRFVFKPSVIKTFTRLQVYTRLTNPSSYLMKFIFLTKLTN